MTVDNNIYTKYSEETEETPQPGKLTKEAAAFAACNLYNKAQENWTSAQGAEILSEVGSVIPDETKNFFSGDKVRSLKVYFGFRSSESYSIVSANLLMLRIKHNLSFFYLNYIIQTSVFFALTLLFSPGSMLEIGMLLLVWFMMMQATTSGAMHICGSSISRKMLSLLLAGCSAFILLYVLAGVFWWAMSSSLFAIALHTIFRDASAYQIEPELLYIESDTESPVVISDQRLATADESYES